MTNFGEKDDIVYVTINIVGINCKLSDNQYSTPDDHHSGGCFQGTDKHEAIFIIDELMKTAMEQFKNKGYKIYSISDNSFSAQKI